MITKLFLGYSSAGDVKYTIRQKGCALNVSVEQRSKKMTKLINYRTYNLDYSKAIPIDRRSMFGNPFYVDIDGTREEVIDMYKEWFYERITHWEAFQDAVNNLKGKTLGCWCTPLPCHGDVIIEYLNGLSEAIRHEGLETEDLE